jgi:hypothetical protein
MSQTAPLRAGGWTVEVRIANPPPALLVKYTSKEKAFFFDYANFIIQIMRDPAVGERLSQIFAAEHVNTARAIDIRVMVFPARPLRGRSNRVLHGSYRHSVAQISLYPLKLPRDWIRQGGFNLFKMPHSGLSTREKKIVYEMAETVIATLVHEVLHAKFESRGMAAYAEESLVRRLETQYMQGWEETILAAIEHDLS